MGGSQISVLPAPKSPTHAENIFTQRDHERYSAIERRLKYGNGVDSEGSSNYNSAHTNSTNQSRPYDDDDIYNAYQKQHIEEASRRNYARDDFKSQLSRPKKEKKLPPGEKPDWQQVN